MKSRAFKAGRQPLEFRDVSSGKTLSPIPEVVTPPSKVINLSSR